MKYSKKEFENLIHHHNNHCITLQTPLSVTGAENDLNKNKITLKNQLKSLRVDLEHYNLNQEEIDTLLEPIEQLKEDNRTINRLKGTLLIHRSPDHFSYDTVSDHYEPFIYIGDHFYLTPLIAASNNPGKFYLLILSRENARLYESDYTELSDNLMPDEIIVEGESDNERETQFRSHSEGQAKVGLHHGHGGEKDFSENEYEKVLRKIDELLMDQLKTENAPLIIAGVDDTIGEFRKICHYNHILDETINGNFDRIPAEKVFDQARNIADKYREKKIKERIERYKEALHQSKGANRKEEIIPAAYNGKIDTLFIRKDGHLWGKYNPSRNTVETHNIRHASDACLYNQAAIQSYDNSGEVFTLDDEFMPAEDIDAFALNRY